MYIQYTQNYVNMYVLHVYWSVLQIIVYRNICKLNVIPIRVQSGYMYLINIAEQILSVYECVLKHWGIY